MREVSINLGPHTGPAGKGPAKGILPISDQDYLGRGTKEFIPGGGVLPRNRNNGSDGESISWGVHRGCRGGEELAGRESRGMSGVRGNPSGGILQAPAVCLCRTAEVTLAGVGIPAADHPLHRIRSST